MKLSSLHTTTPFGASIEQRKGKLKKDFLQSSGVQPFLWYIFMIWDDSEENLLKLLDKLNEFHETIKFTYSYSSLKDR